VNVRDDRNARDEKSVGTAGTRRKDSKGCLLQPSEEAVARTGSVQLVSTDASPRSVTIRRQMRMDHSRKGREERKGRQGRQGREGGRVLGCVLGGIGCWGGCCG